MKFSCIGMFLAILLLYSDYSAAKYLEFVHCARNLLGSIEITADGEKNCRKINEFILNNQQKCFSSEK